MTYSILSSLGVFMAAFGILLPQSQAQLACEVDLDGDGVVAGDDLAAVLSNWGPCAGCAADVFRDGVVNGADVALVLDRWGSTCAPVVTGSTPNEGPVAGGVEVTITGDRLLNPTSVTFGGSAATIVSSTRSSVSVRTPASTAGVAAIVVTTRGGSASAGGFTTFGAPTVAGVAPVAGYVGGGETVIITGTNFYGSPTVRFGKSIAASVTVDSTTQLSVVTPAGGLSTVAISVTTGSGTASVNSVYTFIPAVIPSWATLIHAAPDPSVVTNPALREAIRATGYAWRVRDTASQIEMLLVPPGTFAMGCSQSNVWVCNSDESPVHPVTLTDAFYIGRYEVTQGQWTARMGFNPSTYRTASAQVSAEEVPSRPVEQVSWVEAQQFNALTGLRLPTEAEWEYAYRAGTTTAFHAMPGFPNGTNDANEVGAIAWGNANSNEQTRPVGRKAANGFGLHDMSGNVWEMVNDWYAINAYASSPLVNPPGPATGAQRVLRGGGLLFITSDVRASVRGYIDPESAISVVGFRVARSP